MKYKNKIYLLIMFFVFTACEVKWNMDIEFNEDYSGNYKISILLDQNAQSYALETGQASAIGGLDAILADLPEGYGSSIYQENDFLGILIRNEFENTTELQEQLQILNNNENTSLLLLPVKEINFSESDRSFSVSGIFEEIFVSDEVSEVAYENLFDGKLTLIVPGDIVEPQLENIVENTIIFEIEGTSEKTFELISNKSNLFNPVNILSAFALLSLIYIIVRQYKKNN
jgi:hypothetical protein|tara:strand:+ start:22 stop:708 length:687 start_codon:yes stop_codon:yes gene_type:complete